MQPECLTELQQELHHKYLNGFKLVFLFFCMLLLASLALKDDFLQRKLTFWVLKQVFVFHQENLSIALYFDARKQYQLSKHLKGRFGPPVNNEKCVYQKWALSYFLKLSQEQANYHIFAICFKNFLTRNNLVDVKQIITITKRNPQKHLNI